MKTTNFFIELIVIGFGITYCIVAALILLFNNDGAFLNLDSLSFASVLPITVVVYVLGIIFDRLADQIFDKRDKSILLLHFKDMEAYRQTSIDNYDKSNSVQLLMDYTKSRLRICRAWQLYWIPIGVLTTLILGRMNLVNSMGFVVINVFCILLTILTHWSWKQLTRTFYGRMAAM